MLHLTVAQDGSGDYASVSEAVLAAFSLLSPNSSLFNWYTFLFSLIDALPIP